MKKVFLETNTYSQYCRGNDDVAMWLGRAEQIIISVITLGELYYGFGLGNREIENLRLLKVFLADPRVRMADVGMQTAWMYGVVKRSLRAKGALIPENDIWIAAQAIEVKAELITYDGHFLVVPRLKLWKELKN